jgi:hypothetical protein
MLRDLAKRANDYSDKARDPSYEPTWRSVFWLGHMCCCAAIAGVTVSYHNMPQGPLWPRVTNRPDGQ